MNAAILEATSVSEKDTSRMREGVMVIFHGAPYTCKFCLKYSIFIIYILGFEIISTRNFFADLQNVENV